MPFFTISDEIQPLRLSFVWEVAVKTKLKRMKSSHTHQIPSYLDEFMWREKHGQSKGVAFNSIMRDIAQQYHV